MAKSNRSLLVIGNRVPSGWELEYPCFEVNSVRELREVQSTLLGKKMKVGLDLRGLSFRGQQGLLKVLEQEGMIFVLRTREPVRGTILSRIVFIEKTEKIEKQNIINCLIKEDYGLAKKIKLLR